uniref:Uncharacterized protein ycf18 n=1 Tax=Flintiella sanguinaria TaxID=101926 RepID=A0A1X9PUD8_9RHOD|nr:phycobilisome degradation protein [Flintiella sanguinaria]
MFSVNNLKMNLKQEFKLFVFRQQIQVLSKEQAQNYLLELIKRLMIKDNLVKYFIKRH